MASQVGTPQLGHAQTHACMYGTYANRWKTRKHNAFGPIYWMGGDINEIIIIKSVHLSRGKQWQLHYKAITTNHIRCCHHLMSNCPQSVSGSELAQGSALVYCRRPCRLARKCWHHASAASTRHTHTQPLLHATPSLLNAISKVYHWPLYKMSNC